jgi:drug/metabolite transporter (DMT)-like permease
MSDILVWWITCLIWSSVWLFIKIGVDDLPPIGFAGLRLVIALSVLVPLLALRRTALPRTSRDLRMIAVTGLVLLGVNYALTYWGAQYVSSGLVAVLQAATPAFGLCFGHVLLPDERFSLRTLAALALGIGGVAIICADRLQAGGAAGLAGAVAVTVGGVSVALGYVLVKARLTHLDPAVIMTGQMACAVVPLMTFSLVHDGHPLSFTWTMRAIVALFYLALAGSLLGFWLNYWLLKRMGATKVLSMALVEPLIAVILGVLVLHESVTITAAAGGACILVSVWMLLARPRVRAAGTARSPLSLEP